MELRRKLFYYVRREIRRCQTPPGIAALIHTHTHQYFIVGSELGKMEYVVLAANLVYMQMYAPAHLTHTYRYTMPYLLMLMCHFHATLSTISCSTANRNNNNNQIFGILDYKCFMWTECVPVRLCVWETDWLELVLLHIRIMRKTQMKQSVSVRFLCRFRGEWTNSPTIPTANFTAKFLYDSCVVRTYVCSIYCLLDHFERRTWCKLNDNIKMSYSCVCFGAMYCV